ncbi:MAG: class I SAM-dependent methyltransferase [Chitinophagales bacterium]
MQHGKKAFLEAALVFALCGLSGILLEQYLPGYGIYLFLFAAVLYLSRMIFLYYFDLHTQQKEKAWEILKAQEAWQSIYAQLHFSGPLPATSSFSIAPDFAQYLMRHIYIHKPKKIMELGCGFSTLISAQCMKEFGINGHIYSYEGDAHFMEECAQWLQQLGLSAHVTLTHAPYSEQEIDGNKRPYYILENMPQDVDLIVVDGPPKVLTALSRYPAMHFCSQCISADGSIICDDAARDDMRTTMKLWETAFPAFTYTYIALVRGALLIRKK